jgi:hypothetical protein
MWLDGYERFDCSDVAGLNWVPAAWKVCLHTTETGPAPGLLQAWRNNPGSGMPHFLGVTPDRIVQLLPLTVGAYTLQNPPGGVDTNRSHVIQIEICEYARNAREWSAPGHPWHRALAKWLVDVDRALGGVLDFDTVLPFGDRWVGFPGDYISFGGVFGHQHAPEQPDRHWDPGPIHINELLATARTLRQGDDMALTPDVVAYFDQKFNEVQQGVASNRDVVLAGILRSNLALFDLIRKEIEKITGKQVDVDLDAIETSIRSEVRKAMADAAKGAAEALG